MPAAVEHASLLIRLSTAFAAVASRHSRHAGITVALAVGSHLASPTTTTAHADDNKQTDDRRDVPSTKADFASDCDTKSEGSKSIEKSARSALTALGEQITFGGTLGFATGYAVRTLAKPVLFLLGTEVLFLQYMAHKQWLSVHWGKIRDDIAPRFSRSTMDGLLDILVYRMPFSASFTAGLLVALRTDPF